MHLAELPKIDTHLHLFDPARFPYAADAAYRPAGQEVATLSQMRAVFAANGVERALLVQPTSGYGRDNAAMLDAVAQSGGLWRGIAVVPADIGFDELAALKQQGVAGVAYLLAGHPPGHYRSYGSLTEKLAALDMVLDIQFEGDGVFEALEVIGDSPVRLAIDHCGRPDPATGPGSAAFRALMRLADRPAPTVMKLSGQHKFAPFPWPFAAADRVLSEIVAGFGADRLCWGSDWPFLRVPERVDYSALMPLVARLLPDEAQMARVFRGTAAEFFWGDVAAGEAAA